MAIPGPGTPISINTIVGEFGGTAPHSLSEYYRGGGLVPNTPGNANISTSGAIPMGGFYGSANRSQVALTIAANAYNYDVYANRSPAYVAGATDLTVTVNPGVTVGSTSTGTYAMLVPSAFDAGDTVTIINNGVIQGMGGAGGRGGGGPSPALIPATAGSAGGNSIYVNRPTVITNNGTVAAGGGGGGGGGRTTGPKVWYGGGGGGGGAGFNGGAAGAGGPSSPGVTFGSPGGTGTSPAGGGGGAGAGPGGPGGAGGGRGAAGSPAPGAGGGAAGRYITGNPFVTWPATGTRQGGVA